MKRIIIQQVLIVSLMTVVATVTGPFGTYDDLSAPERAVYWLIAISGIAVMMQLGQRLILTHPGMAHLPYVGLLLLATAIAALPSSVIMVFVDAFFRDTIPKFTFFVKVWAMITAVGAVISYAHFPPSWRRSVLSERGSFPAVDAGQLVAAPKAERQPAPQSAPFFKRLRPELGRELVSISVADHYIEVATTLGRDTLLLRLADAETELADYPGHRVHRSHWVALDQVTDFKRHGHTGTLTMSTGQEIPVARAQVKRVQALLDA